MKKQLFLLFLVLSAFQFAGAQQHVITFPSAKFQTGDNPEWKNPDFYDGNWKEIRTYIPYEGQGYADYNGYSWYRIRFKLPTALLKSSHWKENVLFDLAKIDDVDETGGEIEDHRTGCEIGGQGEPAQDVFRVEPWNKRQGQQYNQAGQAERGQAEPVQPTGQRGQSVPVS